MRNVIPALALSSALVLGGCGVLEDILTVEAPSQVVATDMAEPAAASLLVASVANEFRCALTHYNLASAVTGMEFDDAAANSVLEIWDTRNHDTSGYGAQYASANCGSGNPALYLPLSQTRWLADDVLTKLGEWDAGDVPDKAKFQAETSLWAGFSYLLLGESMCQVVFDGGPAQAVDAAFTLAVARFDVTIQQGSTDHQNVARVGKARALKNMGDLSAASAAAAQVPVGFSYSLDYSNAESVTRNKAWETNIRDADVTVGTVYRDRTFGGVADPRTITEDTGLTGRSGAEVWKMTKYPDASTPIELGSWEEAQLIMAEAHVAGGRVADAVAIIDVLHTNAGLPLYSAVVPGATATQVKAQIVWERGAEMFLEGHHLWDIRAYSIPLEPPVGAISNSGAFYSDELCFQIPAREFQNNENVTG
jgi:hypothetical protein